MKPFMPFRPIFAVVQCGLCCCLVIQTVPLLHVLRTQVR
jgi:hypothetical protein